MASRCRHTKAQPRARSLGLGLLALAAGGLLAGLVSKGCISPRLTGPDASTCPEPARNLTLEDRHGRIVALVSPDGESVSLAPAYTRHCRSLLGEAACARARLALDQPLQQRARELVGRGLRALSLRLEKQGSRDPVSGVLVAIRADGRDVLVLVGLKSTAGRTEVLEELPRRDLGTALKPLLAAAAIASGAWSPDSPPEALELSRSEKSSQVRETFANHVEPLVLPQVAALDAGPGGPELWMPRNAVGPPPEALTLRDALTRSTCCGMVRLAAGLDPAQTRTFLHEMGLAHGPPSGPTPGLGALETDLLAVTNAYATLAAGGWSAAPRLTLAERSVRHRVLTLDQVEDLHRMLQLAALAPGATIGLPGPAGKAGVTADGRDGWFIGYQSGLVIGVWFGLPPDGPVIREPVVTRIAREVWLRLMAEALAAG